MLACCAQEEEEGRESVRDEIRRSLFALHHPTVQDVRKWFLALPQDMGVNEVFEAARLKGLGERYAMALKTLHQHRGTDMFRELVEE
ncbi:MAG: hypothetical protein HYW81_01475 [Parcubacteria group bacterium]|nr:hypothetical protein [Parcubacteria group bacterium]